MNAGAHGWAVVIGCTCLSTAWAAPSGQAPPRRDPPRRQTEAQPLRMTTAVACASISGYQQFVPLEGAALSRDEKLLVYFEPEHFATEKHGDMYQAHLTGDGRVRKRGDKAVLWSKAKLLDYKAESPRSAFPIYISYKVALKGLGPGEYDLDIILHDEVGRGPPAQQTLHFRIKPNAREPEPRKDAGP